MENTVGLLVGERLLRQTVSQKSTFEDVAFYVRAAKECGVELFVFAPEGVDVSRRRMTGYVPTAAGSYRRTSRSLPDVVYDRTSPKHTRTASWLLGQGVTVFNPPIRFDKHDAYQLLSRSRTTQAYLPETHLLSLATYPWFQTTLASGADVFVKPRGGSLGRRVARFTPLANGRCRYQRRGRTMVFGSARSAWKQLLRWSGDRAYRYIVQWGIPLAEDRGRRFDLRVPVQRDHRGEWVVLGARARRAGRVAYVTNLARGGSLEPDVRAMIARSLPVADPDSVYRNVEHVALDTAAQISTKHPLMADLGLDIGIDKEGRPWLIEVNTRPLRYTVKGVGDWSETYVAPIGYAAFLLRHDRRKAAPRFSLPSLPSLASLASLFYEREP